MKWKKKLLALVMVFAFTLVFATSGYALTPSATSTCVMDVESGRVLYSQNADEKRYIASITKIMTGLLGCELNDEEDFQKVLTVSKTAAAEDGSSMYLEAGDKILLESALYGTMLRSGNDAAMLVAEYTGGDEEGFVELMNEKAQEIGMTRTKYGNPNGLVDEGNYSTAYDMCLLGCYAMRNEHFAKIVGTNSITTEDGYTIENHNKLLSRDERCIGIKTGWTTAAGRTLVSCFENPDNGQRIVCCTLNDPVDFDEHIEVYNWAFKFYPQRTLCSAGKTVATVTLAGSPISVPLIAEDTLKYPLSTTETNKVTCTLALPDNATTLEENAVVGQAVYYFGGEEIGRTNLFADFTAEE